jgi:hypothetical protein
MAPPPRRARTPEGSNIRQLIAMVIAAGFAYFAASMLHPPDDSGEALHDASQTPMPADGGVDFQSSVPEDAFSRVLEGLADGCDHSGVSSKVTPESESYFTRANELKKSRRPLEALACYRRAVSLAPDAAHAYNNAANTLKLAQGSLMCGDAVCSSQLVRDAGKRALLTVLHLRPTHANAYTNLASLVRHENRFGEAIHLNRMAVSIEPRHATAYGNLGRALQADSAPMTTVPSDDLLAPGAPWVVSPEGGVRSRKRLEEAAAAFWAALKLSGPRASADDRRGLGYTLHWLNRRRESAEVFAAGVRAGVWLRESQSPGILDARLESAPFPPLERASCIPEILESRGGALVAEAADLLRRSAPLETTNGGDDGGWHSGLFKKEVEGLHTPKDGFAYYDVLSACKQSPPQETAHPAFCETLAELRSQTHAHVELARISRVQAGVSISAHTGLHNRRWRAHLGLKLASSHSAQLRVVGKATEWRVGGAFVFDDSYEHEVIWNPPVREVDLSTREARLVFIVDFLHPDLAPEGTLCPSRGPESQGPSSGS